MKLSINHPHFPKGTLFSVPGLAAIPNGDTAEVDDDTVALFEAANEKSVKDYFANDPHVKVGSATGGGKGGDS